MEKPFSIGARLRALREERGFSQRELSGLSGISTNAISLIERDENSPSVVTLQSLAKALNVKMSYFFEDSTQKQVLHIRSKDRPAITNKGTHIEGAGVRLPRQEIEPFYVKLEPFAGSGERQVVHTGHEFVYCLEGNVEYLIDGELYELQPGDFLVFEANLPHLWRNPTNDHSAFILILQTPNESNEPVNRHFSSYPSITHIGP